MASTKITIGNYLLRRLKELGVDIIFGLPGDYNLVRSFSYLFDIFFKILLYFSHFLIKSKVNTLFSMKRKYFILLYYRFRWHSMGKQL